MQPAPVSEAAAGGGYDLQGPKRGANAFKRTPQYKSAANAASQAQHQQLAARYTHQGPAKTTFAGHPSLLSRAATGLADVFLHPAIIGTENVGSPKSRALPGATASPGLVGAPTNSIAARAMKDTAQAFVEDPAGVTGKTIKGGAEMVVGIPAGLGELAYGTAKPILQGHPAGALQPYERLAKSTVADLNRRYGPLAKGNDRAFINRVKKEGAAPELADATTLATVGGATIGKGLSEAGRAGALGKTVKSVLTEPRPALRLSGSTTVEQEVSPKITRAFVQRGQDVARQKIHAFHSRPNAEGRIGGLQPQLSPVEKSIARHNRKVARQQALLPSRQPGEVVAARQLETPALVPALAPGRIGKAHRVAVTPPPRPAEVVPAFSHNLARRQRQQVAAVSAHSFVANRHEQGVELNQGVGRELAGLSPGQRRATFHVLQGLVPLHGTPNEIRAVLRERKAQIGKAPQIPVLSRQTEPATLDYLIKHTEKVFGDGRLAAFHAVNVERSKRIAAGDPGLRDLTAEVRRHRPQAAFLGIKYEPPISTDSPALETYQHSFIAKVQHAAEQRGLPEPAYFKHEKRDLPQLSVRTAGNVSRASVGPKRTDLKLFREGRAITSPDAYIRGLAASIKRKHQWNAVADVYAQHTFPWGRDKTVEQLRNEIDRHGLRHEDFAFVNLGRMRAERSAMDYLDRPDAPAAVHEALQADTVLPTQAERLASQGDPLVKTSGYSAIPRNVADELLASTKPSGKVGRKVGMLQGLQSAAILGLNPSWIQMQVAANALQAGVGMHGNLLDLARSQAWYRALAPEEKRIVDHAIGGVGVGESHANAPRLGSTAGPVARLGHRVGQVPVLRTRFGTVRVTDANPMSLMFKADNAQNNAFRRAVLYNDLKRQQFSQLTRNVGLAQASIKHLSDMLSVKKGMDARHQLHGVLNDPRAVEQAARHVDDVLGDYLRYTAQERRFFKPFIMFYGFLRYATKTLFYTLPVKHPLAASIAAKIGQLHDDEVRRIFGTRNVPPWVFSRVFQYDANGNVERGPDGRPRSIDLARISPLTGPAIDVVQRGPQALAGLVSPVAQAAFNIIANKNVQQGRPLTVGHSAEEAKHPTVGQYLRIAANQIGSSTYPYRLLKSATTSGTQSDESLPFSDRQIVYKTPAAQAREKQREAIQSAGAGSLLQQTFPLFVPKPDTTGDYLKAHGAGPTAKIDKRIKQINAKLKAMPLTQKRDELGYATSSYQRLVNERTALTRQRRAILKTPSAPKIIQRPLTVRQAIIKETRQLRQQSTPEAIRKQIQRETNQLREQAKVNAGG